MPVSVMNVSFAGDHRVIDGAVRRCFPKCMSCWCCWFVCCALGRATCAEARLRYRPINAVGQAVHHRARIVQRVCALV